MNTLVSTRLCLSFIQGCKTISHPVGKWLPPIKQDCLMSREFSSVSSVVNNHNSQDNHQQKQTKLIYNSVYRLQTRTFMDGYFATIYSTEKNPLLACGKEMLEIFHDTTGLPWWATIVLCTFTLKTFLTFPLAIYCEKIRTKYILMNLELDERMNRMVYNLNVSRRHKVLGLWNDSEAYDVILASRKKLYDEMYKECNCNPVRTYSILIVQMPIWFAMSISLRYLSGTRIPGIGVIPPAEGMSTEGLFWFENMVLNDSTLILPVLFLTVSLVTIQANSVTYSVLKIAKPSKFIKVIRFLGRTYLVFLTVLSAIAPSCIAFYWTTSCVFGLCQNLILLSPKFRTLCGIPLLPNHSLTPYKDFVKVLPLVKRFCR